MSGESDPLPAPVADLIHARYGQPGRFGELLARDALLESLADQVPQLGVGIVERRRTTRPALLSMV